MTTDGEITLFHWNILDLSDEHAIFVGLRVKTGTSSPYVFRYSTSIKSFDESTGIGITESGRVYRCEGLPSDPKGEIRGMVRQTMQYRNYRFRYDFESIQG